MQELLEKVLTDKASRNKLMLRKQAIANASAGDSWN